jgi:hypothetical protein
MRSLVRSVLLIAGIPAAAWAQLTAGAEFRVNSYTTGYQMYPAVASDANGNFVVVWQSSGQFGVFGQRFNASGTPLGAEFKVADFGQRAAVASNPNGDFVVSWAASDGGYTGIFGRRFDALGVPQGSNFRVNSYTTNFQNRPAVASNVSGDFVVVWDSIGQDGSGFGVFGQRYNASGVAQGGEFRVNSYTTGDQNYPSVSSDANGNFLVVWMSSGQDGSVFSVFGQRYNASGVAQGGEFRVNTYTTSPGVAPAVSADGNGNFIVVWSPLFDGNFSGIDGQRFDAAGVRQGSEFQVNSYVTGQQAYPSVSSDASGNFVVVWESNGQDGGGYGIFGRSFNAAGVAQGAEFRVNSYTTGTQRFAAVAAGSDGDFTVVWDSNGQDGSQRGVFGQRYGDMIFEDGFESGGLTRWSSATIDGGDLSVSGAAALAGTSSGLQAFVNDTNSLFVEDDTPNAESRYRARFYFDTNGFDPGESQSHFRIRVLVVQGSGFRLITIVLKRQLGAYSIEARVRRNDGTRADTGFFPISDGPHFVELDWQRSTGPGAFNGSLQFWIDNASVATLTGIDDDLVPVDQVRMGALSLKTGAAGTLYFDQFESRRQRLIGPE